jgi:hypothetical protein
MENMETILNNIFGERFEFKAIRRKFLDEDLLDGVVGRSDQFPP